MIFFTSCSLFQSAIKDREKMLIGTWDLEKVDFPMVETNAESEEIVNDMFKNSFIKFNTDKSIEMKMFEIETLGTWEINKDNATKLLFTDNDKETNEFKIQEISSEKLILQLKNKGNPISLTLKKR